MGLFGNLIARLGMDTSAWGKGSKEAIKQTDTMKKGVLANFREMVNGMDLSKKGGLAKTMKLFEGGGKIYAAKKIAGEAKELTEKLLELKEAYSKGTISSGAFADQLVRSIPIMGDVYAATRNLQELVTGEEAEHKKNQAAFDARIKKQNDATDAMAKWKRETKDAVKEMGKETEKLKQRADLDSISDPVQKKIAEATQDYTNATKELDEKTKALIQQDKIDEKKKLAVKGKSTFKQASEELRVLEKNKAAILEASAKQQEQLEREKNNRINQLRTDADEEWQKQQMDSAEKYDEFVKRKAEEQKDKQIAALKELKSKITDSSKADEIKIAQTSNTRLQHIVAQPAENKQLAETTKQTALLKQVVDKLDKLEGKGDSEDTLIQIAGIQ